MNNESNRLQTVYLVGAGATQACVDHVRSNHKILMRDLATPLGDLLQGVVTTSFSGDTSIIDLVNTAMGEDTDFEHIITFLGEAPSLRHRQFAEEMKKAFEDVLRERLEQVRQEHSRDPIDLYSALLDLYNVTAFPETLHGIMTTNYDDYIEQSLATVYEQPIDFAVNIAGLSSQPTPPRLLKLHGSFGWQDTWPISPHSSSHNTLWIPPGIQKAKQAYPFSVLWGLAREMLNCDVLRVIGCRLGANDWDLISLLFAMQHVNNSPTPPIEIIDSPLHVRELRKSYPYLEFTSLLEMPTIGPRLIVEITGGSQRSFDELTAAQQANVIEQTGERRNWFQLWLKHKVEALWEDLPDLDTPKGYVMTFLQS